MIDIQKESSGITIYIDILTDYDHFTTADAHLVSPTGNLLVLPTVKEADQTAKLIINGDLDEIGIWSIQIVGHFGTDEAYSEVGKIKVHENLI